METVVHSFNCNTGTGLQTITTTKLGGVTPKAVLFCIVGSDVFDDDDTHAKMGWGAADGIREWAMAANMADGQSTTQTGTMSRTDKCLCITTDAGSTPAVDGEAAFDAFVVNGVRIDWTDAVSDDYKVIAIFFAGADVNVRADSVLLLAEDVEQDISAGFKPKCIITAAPGAGATSLEDNCRLSIGAAVLDGGSFKQRSWVYQDYDDVGTTRVRGQTFNNRAGGRGDNTYSFELADPDSDGFSLYARGGSPSSDYVHYLALDFTSQVELLQYLPRTSIGTQVFTGVGFEPDAVIIGHATQTAENTDQEADMAHSFSAFDDTDEYSQSINSEDSSSTSDANSEPVARAIQSLNPAGTNYLYRALHTSMDADGFTLQYSRGAGYITYGWALCFNPDDAPVEGQAFMMVS